MPLVYARAQSIQTLVDEIDSLALMQKPSGVVTISTTQDIAKTWFIPILSEFYKQNPSIVVNIIADDFISDLVHEQIDLAVRVTTKNKNSSFIGRVLTEEHMKLFASEAYTNQFGNPTSMADIAKFHWLMFQQSSAVGSIEISRGRKTHKFKPLKVFETNSPELRRCMIEEGLGVGLHFPLMAKHSVEKGLLQPIMHGYYSTCYNISLVYPSRNLPPRTGALVDYLVNVGWPHSSWYGS